MNSLEAKYRISIQMEVDGEFKDITGTYGREFKYLPGAFEKQFSEAMDDNKKYALDFYKKYLDK